MNKIKTWIPPSLPLMNDLAVWKSICQDVHDNLIDAGCVQTSDTGQLDISAVATLPADGSYAGYRIYEINDALSATHPIYIKLNFGCGSEGLYSDSSWYVRSRTIRIEETFSTATNGAGSLTGNVSSASGYPQTLVSGGDSTDTPTNKGISYYCKNDDAGFLGFFYGIGSRNKPNRGVGSYYGATLGILIQRDGSNGFALHTNGLTNESGDNFLATNRLPPALGQYVPFSGSVSAQSTLLALRANGNASTLVGSDTILQPVFYASAAGLKQWPSLVTYRHSDIAAGTEFTLEAVTGSPKKFIALGNETSLGVDPIVGQSAAFAMLFDGT